MNYEEWSKTIELFNELWPATSDFSPAMLSLWRKNFGHLNQKWVRDAMERVRSHYSSKEPEIKWVHEAFNAVRKDESAAKQGDPHEAKRAAMRELAAQVAQDNDEILNDLLRMDDGIRNESRSRVKRMFGGSDWEPRNDSDDPREWSAFVRGCVHGEAQHLMERVA